MDTNLVIYAFDSDAGPKNVAARRVLKAAASTDLVLPLQVLNESFAVLTQRFEWPPQRAREALFKLVAHMTVAPPSEDLSWKAMRLSEQHGLSFWDSLIVAASAMAGCSLLLTEDLQDGRLFGAADLGRPLRILNPFSAANHAVLVALGLG